MAQVRFAGIFPWVPMWGGTNYSLAGLGTYYSTAWDENAMIALTWRVKTFSVQVVSSITERNNANSTGLSNGNVNYTGYMHSGGGTGYTSESQLITPSFNFNDDGSFNNGVASHPGGSSTTGINVFSGQIGTDAYIYNSAYGYFYYPKILFTSNYGPWTTRKPSGYSVPSGLSFSGSLTINATGISQTLPLYNTWSPSLLGSAGYAGTSTHTITINASEYWSYS